MANKDKSLKDKAVDIKGKKYVLVSDRVLYFNEKYPEGCIVNEMLSWEGDVIIVKSVVYPEGIEGRYFTGYAQEVVGSGMVNKTSALENAETSAVGRALAMMGIGVIDSIASVDEVNKAENRLSQTAPRKTCQTCGKEFNPNPKAKFAKDCLDCWKAKQNGEEVKQVKTDEPTPDEIPF